MTYRKKRKYTLFKVLKFDVTSICLFKIKIKLQKNLKIFFNF